MKIRIHKNTLRFRLNQVEVLALITQGYWLEQTDLGINTLHYGIEITQQNHMSSELIGHKISVFIPQNWVKEWERNDQVGFKSYQNGLTILVEKDFKCLVEGEEDQSENYPNPLSRGELPSPIIPG